MVYQERLEQRSRHGRQISIVSSLWPIERTFEARDLGYQAALQTAGLSENEFPVIHHESGTEWNHLASNSPNS